MKRWTRKLLAGLLSFGMLLQVASPLSALAADGSSAAPGLTVTVNDEVYTLVVDSSGQVMVPNEWTDSNLPNVSYDATTTTYTLTGQLGSSSTGAVVLSGTGSPNLTLQNSTGGVVWAGQLDVTGVNNFKASTDSNSSAIRFNIISGCERNATINCTGNIEITAKDGNAVYDGALVVESAQSVTVKSTGSRSTLSNYSTISCTGKVDIQNTGTGEAAIVGLKVKNADSVALSSNNSDRTVGDLHVEQCSGSVEVTNSGSGRAIYNYLSVGKLDNGIYTYTASSVTINGNIGGYTRTYCNGDITINGAILGANSSKYTWRSDLMSQNGIVTVDGGAEAVPYLVGGSAHVMGEQVVLRGNATTTISRDYNQSGIKAETKVLTVENTGSGTVGYAKFTAEKGTDYDIYLDKGHATQTDVSLSDLNDNTNISSKYLYVAAKGATPDNAELKITAGGKDYRIDPKDISEYGKEYTIGYDTFLISYHSEYDEFDIYGTVPDGTQIEGIGTHRPALQMTASTAGGIARPLTYGSLTIKNMGDVDLNGVIHENLTIENVKDVSSGVVGYAGSGNLIINGAENVKYLTHVFGTIDINCTGEVNIYGSRNGSVSDGAKITAKSLMMKSVSINGSVGNVGHVKFTRTDTAGNYRILTGENEDTITSQTAMNGETFDQTVEETYLCIEPGTPHQHTLGDWEHDGTNHWKICSGCNEKVGKAPHDFGSDDICKECGYEKPAPTPDHQHTASTEWKYDGTNHWHTCTNCDVQMDKAPHNFGEDGKAEKCVECGFANPDYVAPDPDDTGTVDSGSDAGGAVAAVLVGGAAVLGGYEIATRVILHNILPEGAAIPANRGQLALLVWNNAGRPEPAAQSAFADVADADMAKAAQWCVEQGIMDAKTAETFKPEGWTPKLKVIEVWNKAFPKQ